MIISKCQIIFKLCFFIFFIHGSIFASSDFKQWKKDFQQEAIKSGISEKVVKEIMFDAKFLPKVIEYDRFQPNFMKTHLRT